MSDNVNHPAHYNQIPGVECIDVVEWMPFNIGNAIKYLWRAEHKNGTEDLEKAAWYIQREIERVRGIDRDAQRNASGPVTVRLRTEGH